MSGALSAHKQLIEEGAVISAPTHAAAADNLVTEQCLPVCVISILGQAHLARLSPAAAHGSDVRSTVSITIKMNLPDRELQLILQDPFLA
jgi:hypothetical protein